MVAVVVLPPVVMHEFPARVLPLVVSSSFPYPFFPGVVVLVEMSQLKFCTSSPPAIASPNDMVPQFDLENLACISLLDKPRLVSYALELVATFKLSIPTPMSTAAILVDLLHLNLDTFICSSI